MLIVHDSIDSTIFMTLYSLPHLVKEHRTVKALINSLMSDVCGIFFYAGTAFTKTEIQRLRNTPWKLDKSN